MGRCNKHSRYAPAVACPVCEIESLRQQLKEGCEETVRYWDMYHEQRARAEIAEEQLAAKDAELEERNNVMHRAVEDAESLRKEVERLKDKLVAQFDRMGIANIRLTDEKIMLQGAVKDLRKEVERLHREKWEARDRLEKAEKERDEALKASNAQFAENEELDKGREYQLAEITLLQRDLKTAEERVRELEENNADAENRTIILEKRIKELEDKCEGLNGLAVKRQHQIKALVEAGDAILNDCRGGYSTEQREAWDKAKGEAGEEMAIDGEEKNRV